MATATPTTKDAPGEGKGQGREPFTVAVQTEWFKRNKGKIITLRLMDGSRFVGVLEAWDNYTVAIWMAGREESILVNKHGVALFRRFEEQDKEKAPAAPKE